MEWEAEYTDDFGEWWEALTEGEQEDVTAVVGLLEKKGHSCLFRTVRTSKARSLGKYGNCESSTRVNLTGFCMLLTRDESPCFLSVVARSLAGQDRRKTWLLDSRRWRLANWIEPWCCSPRLPSRFLIQ